MLCTTLVDVPCCLCSSVMEHGDVKFLTLYLYLIQNVIVFASLLDLAMVSCVLYFKL